MSSILKALKKLEAEKTLHQEAAAVNLSREILRKQPGGRSTALWLWLTVLVALAIIATLTALLLAKPARSPQSSTAPPAPVAAPAAATPLPAPGTPPTAPAESNARTGSAPRLNTTERRPLPDNPVSPTPATPAAAGSSKAAPADSTTPASSPLPADTVKRAPQRQTEPAAPQLTLSGIAWNKDSADRLAIINGQPTATGATVAGVVVEEILPDRVKVNSAGRSFEIFLGSPAKTN